MNDDLHHPDDRETDTADSGTEHQPDARGDDLSATPEAQPSPASNGQDRKAEIIAELAEMDVIDAGKIIKAKAADLGVNVTELRTAVAQKRKAAKDAARAADDAEKTRAKAEEEAQKKARLTGEARQAELDRLADLKESDPFEYDAQCPDATTRLGCLLGTLREQVDKIIAERIAERLRNNPSPPSGPHADTLEVTALIAEFNARYFVLNEAGKTVIYAPKHDHQLHRDFFERITFDDFQRLYLNRFVKTGVSEKTGEPIYSGVANVWLRHRNRHQYIGGMVFDPSDRQQPEDVLNLWHGFGVTARPGSCQRFKDHIRDVVCCGDTMLYDYVMDWCADAVQHPDQRGQIALVLCGPEGTGKGIFANAMKRLFGQHGLAISNARHLIGHFNAHLRDVVLLFADEAFYAGDRAHTSILKAIITEGQMVVEAKYQNAVSAKNFLHIIMASNERWVVPTSLDSRRFVVFAVDLSRIGDFAYFAAIERELENGGYEALLEELLARDLSGVNLRHIPVTDALITQRKLSLPITEAWWMDCLSRAYVFRSELGLEDHFHEWLDPISTELLYQSYEKYCRAHGERHPLSRELLGQWLGTTAGCQHTQPARSMVGEHITDATTTGSNFKSRVAEPVWRNRANAYWVHPLTRARADFLKATGLTMEWPPEAGDEPSP